MTRYYYRAAGPGGTIVTGHVSARSPEAGNRALDAEGLVAIELRPATVRTRPRHSAAEAALLFRSLANMLGAGVPLERAITLTEGVLGTSRLRPGLEEVRLHLQQGKTLADALDETPGMAPATITGIIRAGEQASRLVVTLELVASHLEREHETAVRLRQALAYPAVLLVTGSLSIFLMTAVVLPRFASILADAGGALPPLARLLLGVTSLPVWFWVLGALGFLSALALLVAWRRTPSGQLEWNRLLLRVPVVGPIRGHLSTASLSRSLGTGLVSGLPMLKALAAAADAASDPAIRVRLLAARDRIASGAPLARTLMEQGVVEPTAGQLLAVGESSGQLGAMAHRAAELAGAEAERRIALVVRLVEPALILFFGGILAVVAGALLQTVYSLRPGP